MNEREPSSSAIGPIAGVVTALAVMTFCGLAGYAWGQRKIASVKKGWTIVSAVAAARDLPADTTLAVTDVEAIELPEQFVTTETFSAAELGALPGSRLGLAVARGALLRPGLMTEGPALTKTCARSFEATAAELQLSQDADVLAFLSSLGAGSR
jgi:hypothetical protein